MKIINKSYDHYCCNNKEQAIYFFLLSNIPPPSSHVIFYRISGVSIRILTILAWITYIQSIPDMPVITSLLNFLISSFPFWIPEPVKFQVLFLPVSVSFPKNIVDRSAFSRPYPDFSAVLSIADDLQLFLLPHQPDRLLYQ